MSGKHPGMHPIRRGTPAWFAVLLWAAACALPTRAAEPAVTAASRTNLWAPFVEPDFPFFSSVLEGRKLGPDAPGRNLTPRGIVLNVGNGLWAAFDTELLRVSAVWAGDGPGVTPVSMSQISYQVPGAKVSEGEKLLPEPVGTPWLANGLFPGWQSGDQLLPDDPRPAGPDPLQTGRGPLAPSTGRFQALRLVRAGVVLDYRVHGVGVREQLVSDRVDGSPVLRRTFELPPLAQPLVLALGRPVGDPAAKLHFGLTTTPEADERPGPQIATAPDGTRIVRVPPSTRPATFTITMGIGAPVEGRPTSRPGPAIDPTPPTRRWPQAVITRSATRESDDAYVVENIPPPVDNPWKRNVRFADLAFFPDGRAAAVTFDGDLWRIDGLRGDLSAVRWERFASGFHEPMSLCIRDGQIHVLDRNGIWRVRDTDGNGEADLHELVSNIFTQGAETREYAQSIRTAPDGSFVIAKGGIQMAALGRDNGSVIRVSPDGTRMEVLGYGFRSPFAAVHPVSGVVTASDQQGHYVPTTPIHLVAGGHFHGFLASLRPKEVYPESIAEPLTWIPYPVNSSGAGQAWITDDRMGPLNGTLIHVGYYRPELFAVRLHHRAPVPQAFVASITRDFDFAPLNAAVNPADGQLYVIGLQIWGSVAKQITGLARLRYTGKPSTLPTDLVATDQGILLGFDVPLDPAAARDAANFSAERWEYRRTANYGSPHFKLDGSKGQEPLIPSSAYLSKDGRRVFVGIRDLRPVMQMRIGWSLTTRAGRRFAQNAYFTVKQLTRFDPVAEGFEPFEVDLNPRRAAAVGASPVSAEEGRRLAELMGCAACHSIDGTVLGKVGPTWKGLYGSQVALADGTTVEADAAYLRESIREPMAKVVSGYDKSETAMPSYEGVLSEAQVEALVLYLQSLGEPR